MASITTIKTLLGLATNQGHIIHQMDVHTAFLHGQITEELYMDQQPQRQHGL